VHRDIITQYSDDVLCFWSQALLRSVTHQTLTCRCSCDTKRSARAEEKLSNNWSELWLQVAQNNIAQIREVFWCMNLELNTSTPPLHFIVCASISHIQIQIKFIQRDLQIVHGC